MKQSLQFSALLFILLLFSSKISATFLATKQDQKEKVNLNEVTSKGDLLKMEGSEEIINLMGMEVCENEDEECLKRRIISEAHLDYIYTQHHKP